ncbi:Ivy family c-type lysozyme inhibitor [Bradyrhizobium sp. Tv2a-2]|uniref:Ivy family c-type lysozyme inhibitor n=1 Tax=Bradyrhizobium sp. Tv2a-2 TaxID=113395 RepID=UPI000409B493|nr:Ivy family c-type lysozyme inhibitor [Bradyrhizobium sp. Tv2a-2]
MQWQFRLGLVVMYVACSPAIAAEPYLSNMIKKPAYAQTLKSLLDHAGNLPSWTQEVLKPKGARVESTAIHAAINGTVYDVFFSCEPHNCNAAALVVMFAPNGTQAWGALLKEGTISYLGTPSDAQQAVLKKELGPKL